MNYAVGQLVWVKFSGKERDHGIKDGWLPGEVIAIRAENKLRGLGKYACDVYDARRPRGNWRSYEDGLRPRYPQHLVKWSECLWQPTKAKS